MGTIPKIHPWEGSSVLSILLIYRWGLTCHCSNITFPQGSKPKKDKENSNCSPFPSSPELARQRHWAWVTIKMQHHRAFTEKESYITEGTHWNSSQNFFVLPPSENHSPKLAISALLAMFGERQALQKRVLKGSKLSLELCKTCLQQMPWRWICFSPGTRVCLHNANRIPASKSATPVCTLWFPVLIASGLVCRESQPRVWRWWCRYALKHLTLGYRKEPWEGPCPGVWLDSGIPSPFTLTHHQRARPEFTNLSDPERFESTSITCVAGQRGCKNEESKGRKTVYWFFMWNWPPWRKHSLGQCREENTIFPHS